MDNIVIKGAREHNLKNIDITLPRDKFIVFTGISGSGKSTLAFDTIFAEGQRRYLESLSSYARQFLGQMKKPEVDYIEGLSPAISIDQKSASHNPRSTVGTVTEIQDYLRLLFAKIGVPHCPQCQKEISALSLDEMVNRLLALEKKGKKTDEVEILAPVVRGRKGEYTTLLLNLFRQGFSEVYVNGKKHKLDPQKNINLERYETHKISVVVDRLVIDESQRSRIFESMERALRLAEGIVSVVWLKNKSGKREEMTFNQKLACPEHDISFPELEPRLFSFNSPYGACPVCEGLGLKKEVDPELVVPDKDKTIAEGALLPWSYKRNNYQGTIIRAVTNHFHISENVRFRDLSKEKQNILLFGATEAMDMIEASEAETIAVSMRSKTGSVWKFNVNWRGVTGFLQDRYFKTDSDSVRTDIEKYMSQNPCSFCNGSRYKKEVLLVTIGQKNIHEIATLNVGEALTFFKDLKLDDRSQKIAGRILKEVISRLKFLDQVGLNYLTLARSANSLAGGETQRIRLASQIGSGLTGVLYILDEPSIGLHARDNDKLLETLLQLRDLGNTLIVIEHDEETMRAADYLVDIGPRAGEHGGEIVAEGTPEEVIKNKKSLTAQYLRGEKSIAVPRFRRPIKNKKWLVIRGARENNLKNITVEFPLKVLTAVTGVSGSGKSTLVEEILYKSLSSKLMRTLDRPGKHSEVSGIQYLDKVIMIDQSPIGRTPRSNPATYTGLFTSIREIFAQTKEAKAKGFGAGRFSFNVKGGRCETCQGEGFLKVEMQFMPDVYLPCDVCLGARYDSETLKVKYKGKNIAEVLAMTVSEAKEFFSAFPAIFEKLSLLDEVGLGYIHLGQAATTLSGGEAQRIKLATELARRSTGDTLYILDEPTTGLHFEDINNLMHILNRLVDAGNTVIVIEHNLDVIKTADWIVDLGPEGGDEGGKVIVTGTPEEVARYADKSYTAKYLKESLKTKD